jgi:hypothetical protein
MNSTQAIQKAIFTVAAYARDINTDPLTRERLVAEAQEVISQLQRLPQASGSNYGTLWGIDDLRTHRPAWSDDTLTAWMESEGGHLSDRQCEDGWETIGTLLEIDGMCEGCGEDSSDDVCPKCEDDYEITNCIECNHVMRRDHIDDDICQVCS